LPHRPIHLTVDNKGSYAFVTYADPCGITVHRLADDGSIGETVPQPNELDVGSYGHQARTMPGNRAVVLVARGHNARGEAAEVPGALKVFSIDDGVLHNRQSVAPGGGFGFGPRHLDFHPTGSWMYVSLERQNALQVFAISENDAISGSARYSAGYLEHPAEVQPRQMGGTVHVHPSGRFVYVVNRADRTKIVDGKSVFAGGENSIVVFSIDERTGEPRLIQRIAPETMHVRTFAIDPSGALLVAAGIMPLWVPRGEELKLVPAALSVFRIGQDGKLSFVRKHEVDAGPRPQWWMGIVTFAETA
jgi:6-phosphogluconolactonase (cycloisomerase 2 family)